MNLMIRKVVNPVNLTLLLSSHISMETQFIPGSYDQNLDLTQTYHLKLYIRATKGLEEADN